MLALKGKGLAGVGPEEVDDPPNPRSLVIFCVDRGVPRNEVKMGGFFLSSVEGRADAADTDWNNGLDPYASAASAVA